MHRLCRIVHARIQRTRAAETRKKTVFNKNFIRL